MYDENTRFVVESQEDYEWLMQHLEELGYLWCSGERPTEHPEYFRKHGSKGKYGIRVTSKRRIESVGVKGDEITIEQLKGTQMQEITKSQYEAQIKELQDKLENLKKFKVVEDTFSPTTMGEYVIYGDCDVYTVIGTKDKLGYNTFKTKEKAEKVSKSIKFLLMCEQFKEIHCPDFEFTCGNTNYFITYIDGEYVVEVDCHYKIPQVAYMNETSAEKLAMLLNDGKVVL